jgi:hypothetical protein
MAEPKKKSRPSGQLNAEIGVSEVEKFNLAIQRNGHKKLWVVGQLISKYVSGEIKL